MLAMGSRLQSGSLLLCHMASHLRPSCTALVLIFFSAVVICLHNISSPMGPPWNARSSARTIISTLLPRFSCSS